jgi:hypothetical protein
MSRARWILLAGCVLLGLWMAVTLDRHRVPMPHVNPNDPPPGVTPRPRPDAAASHSPVSAPVHPPTLAPVPRPDAGPGGPVLP